MYSKLLALTLILAIAIAAAVVGTSRATDYPSADNARISLGVYKKVIWNQFHWTNRALRNRCRETFEFPEFTKAPASSVSPQWRDDHIRYAKKKHHRAQAKSSLCKPWPDWFEKGAMCIHSFEGAWDDPNAPYWGGMQMDLSFQKAYGPEFYAAKGTADNWTVYEQLLAAWRGYIARGGWGPWPNTARYCGLL